MATEAETLASIWFNQSVGRISFKNDVVFYTRGADAFGAIADAVLSPDVDANSFILLLGWSCQIDFQLKPGDPKSTLREVLKAVDSRKTSIRAMVWKNWWPYFDNAPVVTFIKGLAQGDAILDNRTAIAGSHHQKLLVVYGKSMTVAFCGGMDIHEDRIKESGFGPLHDVHCKVTGPACDHLLATFIERWNDHPARGRKPPTLTMPPRTHAITRDAPLGVQVARTYPSITYIENTIAQSAYNQFISLLKQHAPAAIRDVPPVGEMRDSGLTFRPYVFSRGEQGVWNMIRHGIETAATFIYMEEQYLLSRSVSAALADKLRAHKVDKKFRIIILICHTSMVDVQQAWERRMEFITDLKRADPTGTMWTICHRTPIGGPKSYVHSKTWIFDDALAIVGSANCSRRCYTEDSECNIAVVGREAATIVRRGAEVPMLSFAQRLRCELWAKHLGKTPSDWVDAMKTAGAWFTPPRGASIAPYGAGAGTDEPSPKELSVGSPIYPMLHDMLWKYIIEPDGS